MPIFNHHLCEKARSGPLCHNIILRLQYLVFATLLKGEDYYCKLPKEKLSNLNDAKTSSRPKAIFVQQLVHILKVVILKTKSEPGSSTGLVNYQNKNYEIIEPGSSTGLVNGDGSGCHHHFEDSAFRRKSFQMQQM